MLIQKVNTIYLMILSSVFYVVHIDHPSCMLYDGAGDSLDIFLVEKSFCSKNCEKVHKSKSCVPFVFITSIRRLTKQPKEIKAAVKIIYCMPYSILLLRKIYCFYRYLKISVSLLENRERWAWGI